MKLFHARARRPMSCPEVGRLLQRYLDGHLDPARAAKLRDHLEHCRRCGLEAATYERIKAALAQGANIDEDDAALQRLRAFAARLVLDEDDRSR